MVDILNGSSDHHVAAPLSSGQTIQICRHLAEQTRQLQVAVDSLRKEFSSVGGTVKSFQNGQSRSDGVLQSLQEGFKELEKGSERTRKEFAKANGRLQALEHGFEQSGESYVALREGCQMTRTHVDRLQVTNSQMQSMLNELQAGLERNFQNDNNSRDALDHTAATLARAQERLGDSMDAQKEAMMNAEGLAGTLRNDFDKACTRLETQEVRLVDTTHVIQQMDKVLQETKTHGLKLDSEHARTRAQVTDDSRSLKELQTKAKKMDDDLRKTVGSLSLTQQQVASAHETLTAQGGKLRIAEHAAQRLGQESQARNDLLQEVQRRAEEANVMANAVKEGLKETNSMVLPNVLKDTSSTCALPASMTAGSFPFDTARSPPSPLSAHTHAVGSGCRPSTTPGRRRPPSTTTASARALWCST